MPPASIVEKEHVHGHSHRISTSIPENGFIRHHDELPERAKGTFLALATGVPGEAVLDESTVRPSVDDEYTKFTND